MIRSVSGLSCVETMDGPAHSSVSWCGSFRHTLHAAWELTVIKALALAICQTVAWRLPRGRSSACSPCCENFPRGNRIRTTGPAP